MREGTEGPYAGNGGALRVGTPHEVATEVSVNTRFGVERVVRDAFARAQARDRGGTLTLVHKNNVLIVRRAPVAPDRGRGRRRVPRREHRLPARRRGHDLPRDRPRRGSTSSSPTTCSATSSPTSRPRSPAASGWPPAATSTPTAPAPSMFEPVHGSAPDIAGQGKADPTATILSVAHAARPPRRSDEAARVEAAVAADLAARGDAVRTTPRSGTPSRRASDPPPAPTHGPLEGRAARSSTAAWPAPPGRAGRTASAGVRPAGNVRPVSPPGQGGLMSRQHCRSPSPSRQDPLPVDQREAVLASPGFGKYLHRPHGAGHLDGRAGLARRQAHGVRAARRWTPPPRCCTTRRRSSRASRPTATPDGSVVDVPARGERGPVRSVRPRRLALPVCPRRTSSSRCARSSPPTRRGSRPGTAARPASTCGRSCSPPRRSSACVRPRQVTYCVIASPAGAYFAGGLKPVSIWLSTDYTRAAPGGTGAAKCGGNYAASLARPGRGHRQRLRPGGLPRRGRAPVGRGARRDEPLLRAPGRQHRHPRAHRDHPRGHHPVLDPRAGRGAGAPGQGAPHLASTSGARASRPVTSPRSSPAAPPRW